MVQAEHLRIGSLVDFDIRKAIPVTIENISDIDNGHLNAYGIELTPEWLERMGFRDRGKYGCLTLIRNDHRISLDVEQIRNEFKIIDPEVEIKYVHQLQNLYRALTNQEITIKELVKI